MKGLTTTGESHGTEMPGHISAGADATKETALALLLLWMTLTFTGVGHVWTALIVFSAAWLIWKTGRSAWLGWSRLERLHRLIEEEKWEIEHRRPQEREELYALYGAKGFEGHLLDEVVDVLMADEDRLLRVMLEEELGLFLEVYEHPLKQAAGACIGALVSIAVSFIGLLLWPAYGLPLAALLLIGAGGATAAVYESNRLLPSIIWNLALAALSSGVAYFTLRLLGSP